MSRSLAIVLVVFAICAGFIAGWFLASQRLQKSSAAGQPFFADAHGAILDCNHASDDQFRTISNYFYDPGKKTYPVEWQVCLGELQRHRVRVIDPPDTVLFQYTDDSVDKIDTVDLLADHKPELFILTGSLGTADTTTWHIIDESNGKLREWKWPDYDIPAEKLLRSDEDFCCKSWGLNLEARGISLVRPVFRKGDANCCPSRGGIIVHLKPTRGAFVLLGISRLTKSQYDRLLNPAG